MKKLLVTLSILCLFGVADAKKCVVTGAMPLFPSLASMSEAYTLWVKNKDLGAFAIGEMLANGEIIVPQNYDEFFIMHTMENGVTQVLYKNKVYYTIEQGLKCRW